MKDSLKPMLSVRGLVKPTNKILSDEVFEWELWEILSDYSIIILVWRMALDYIYGRKIKIFSTFIFTYFGEIGLGPIKQIKKRLKNTGLIHRTLYIYSHFLWYFNLF